MTQFNNTMYQSLSEYVCTHAEPITNIETLKEYDEFCKKDAKTSFEYSGIYCTLVPEAQDLMSVIEDPMEEWFKANGLSYPQWFSETTANCQWMVRHIPDTYGNVFHRLLMDVIEYQNIKL